MKTTAEDLKAIIYQALTPNPPPLIAEPIGNEMPPVLNEGVEDKLFIFLQKMTGAEREKLFARFGFYLKAEVSKELSQKILSNISDLKLASTGKYPS